MIGGQKCLDPGPLREAAERLGIPADFWGRASSISCPVGMEPGSAWFLVSRTIGDGLAANDYHELKWVHESGTTTWQKYVLHRAVLVGLDGDGNAPYLVEFRDKRQVLKLGSVNRTYNVRRQTRGYDTATTDLYYTDSRASGPTDYTWQTMFDDLWSNLPSGIRGTAPTLPYSPTGDPENFRFYGSAWEAIGQVLEVVQSVLCYDPVADAFTVKRIGEEQSGLTAARSALSSRRMLTYGPRQDLNRAVAPATIRFFFPKRLECDHLQVETDAGTHLVAQFHTIDKTTSLTGAETGTVMAYHCRHVAEVDSDGSTINNSSTLDTLAGELRDKIVDRINRGTERGRDWFKGIVTTATPGSELSEIVWRDYGDRNGCVTEWRQRAELGMASSLVALGGVIPIDGKKFIGKASEAIAAGASGKTVRIWTGTPGSESDSGIDLTNCCNRTGIDIASGAWVTVEIALGGHRYVEPYECPA